MRPPTAPPSPRLFCAHEGWRRRSPLALAGADMTILLQSLLKVAVKQADEECRQAHASPRLSRGPYSRPQLVHVQTRVAFRRHCVVLLRRQWSSSARWMEKVVNSGFSSRVVLRHARIEYSVRRPRPSPTPTQRPIRMLSNPINSQTPAKLFPEVLSSPADPPYWGRPTAISGWTNHTVPARLSTALRARQTCRTPASSDRGGLQLQLRHGQLFSLGLAGTR